MKPIQGHHLIKPEDLSRLPSNLMRISNADYLESTGSENFGAAHRFYVLTTKPGFEMRGAEKLVFVRDETAGFQRDAEVSGLLVRDDRAGVTIGFQKLPDHFVKRDGVRAGQINHAVQRSVTAMSARAVAMLRNRNK